ncbi:MAG: MG2 domain-containing protein [Vicingaceae bacterium]|nr:MG2 domain-containing protein [Vicingaceae bacterium]
MKNLKIKSIKNLIAVIAIVAAFGSFITISVNGDFKMNEFLQSLKVKLDNHNKSFPEDRVYVQLDKPLYKPGETIWLSAFIRNATDMKASDKSDILYVELIDPKGNVAQKHQLIAHKGKTSADFLLDENVMGGIYKVKAYTNWQKNANDFFEKEIQVQKVVLPRLKMKMEFLKKAYGPGDEVVSKVDLQTLENQPLSNYSVKYMVQLNGQKLTESKLTSDNEGLAYVKFQLPNELTTNDGLLNVMIDYEGRTESISRSVPITLGNIELGFYPEGGDLVDGLISKMAFKALNEFGKPADIKGVIKDNEGNTITNFESFHNGMGAFNLEPKIGKTYYAVITHPKGINKKYSLPKSLKRGWTMNVNNAEKEKLAITIQSTETETMSLAAQVRGEMYFATEINIARGKNEIEIPTKDFPMGVAQITLFDSKNIERAERLVFVNKDKKLNISLKTDKAQYLPREKVKMDIEVTDERGLPMPANLSLAVVDDKLLSFADDKSSNILSSLLLEDDLKTKVEEPQFYFNDKEPKANEALDYLLMTDGWRRFTWEKVMAEDFPAIQFEGEKAIIKGRVMNNQGKPMANAIIKNTKTKKTYKTTADGYFSITNETLYQPTYFEVTAKDMSRQGFTASNYNQNHTVYLYDPKEIYSYSKSVRTKRANVPAAAVDMIVVEEDMMQVDGMAFDKEAESVEQNMVKVNVDKKAPVKEDKKKEAEKMELDEVVIVGNDQGRAFANQLIAKDQKILPNVNYYRAREFATPNYTNNQEVDIRTDFRSTIFWDGNIEVGNNGQATVEFFNSDEVTSFRTIVEGVGVGMIGRAEYTHFTQLPFSMSVKVPSQVVFGDVVEIPLTLKNTTNKDVVGNLMVKSPKGFKVLNVETGNQMLAANTTKTIYLNYEVLNEIGEDNLEISFKANGLKDAFVQPIKIGPKGFPVSIAFSGQDLSKTYSVSLSDVVDGSLQASLTAYPNVVNDLMKGIESIIREPSGCFEQTSMSNYPNIMAMSYMKETGMDNPELFASIDQKLDRGYKRLTSYETKEKGYEWFGSSPGHEALTAYGLMQFNDMKHVYADVSSEMVMRTSKWLMSRKDGKGGFKKNPRALDQFGRASEEVTNAYIVYALSEANYAEISKELEAAYSSSTASNDAYQLALMTNTLFNYKDKRAESVLKALLKLQEKDGSWNANHSITRSGGVSLKVETTALAMLAMLKADKKDIAAITKAAEFLVSSRSGSGSFGSTQGTVLALKALTTFAKFSKQTKESGVLECVIDGKVVASKKYEAGEKNAIEFKDLDKHLKVGNQKIEIRYKDTKNALPYTMSIDYNTTLPLSSKECKIAVEAELNTNSLKVGETVRLTTKVSNKEDKGMPMTMAVVGIPSGLSAQPWQLKELQEKGTIGFYEITDNFVVFYFRDLAPNASHTINLDLKAEVPGEFEAPATSGYLYYTNEYKCWSNTGSITIKK